MREILKCTHTLDLESYECNDGMQIYVEDRGIYRNALKSSSRKN